jgi:predicted nucleic acid-binding protein
LIVAETTNILNYKLKIDKKIVKKVYEELNNNYTIIEDYYFHDKALNHLINYEKRIPFFDHIYIVLMEELGIKEIVSFDKHFDNIKGITRIY